jgi:hypothetical protein
MEDCFGDFELDAETLHVAGDGPSKIMNLPIRSLGNSLQALDCIVEASTAMHNTAALARKHQVARIVDAWQISDGRHGLWRQGYHMLALILCPCGR